MKNNLLVQLKQLGEQIAKIAKRIEGRYFPLDEALVCDDISLNRYSSLLSLYISYDRKGDSLEAEWSAELRRIIEDTLIQKFNYEMNKNLYIQKIVPSYQGDGLFCLSLALRGKGYAFVWEVETLNTLSKLLGALSAEQLGCLEHSMITNSSRKFSTTQTRGKLLSMVGQRRLPAGLKENPSQGEVASNSPRSMLINELHTISKLLKKEFSADSIVQKFSISRDQKNCSLLITYDSSHVSVGTYISALRALMRSVKQKFELKYHCRLVIKKLEQHRSQDNTLFVSLHMASYHYTNELYKWTPQVLSIFADILESLQPAVLANTRAADRVAPPAVKHKPAEHLPVAPASVKPLFSAVAKSEEGKKNPPLETQFGRMVSLSLSGGGSSSGVSRKPGR